MEGEELGKMGDEVDGACGGFGIVAVFETCVRWSFIDAVSCGLMCCERRDTTPSKEDHDVTG